MSRRKANDLEKHVAVSLPKQFVLEAQSLHMSPTTYWKYLKHLANYASPYDQILAANEAQHSKSTQDNVAPQVNADQGKADKKDQDDDLYTNYEGKEGSK
jgi:hypothetical protein